MKVYLINLDERTDRLSRASKQLNGAGCEFERVSAVKPSKDFERTYPYVTPGVAAIWLSHMECMERFLKTEQEYALILEDDFLLPKNLKSLEKILPTEFSFDFFQVGFLVTNLVDRVDIWISNGVDLLLKILSKVSKLSIQPFSQLHGRFLIKDQIGTTLQIVRHDIRPGAHAYIVSRSFARDLIQMNRPLIFSTDAFYISLAKMRGFTMLRFRKSRVGQDGSTSSIGSRFVKQSS